MFIFSSHSQFLTLVVALRIERSATRLSDAFELPALDYLSIKSGASELNRPFFWVTRFLLPRQACFHLHLRPTTFNALWGIRTRPLRLERPPSLNQ